MDEKLRKTAIPKENRGMNLGGKMSGAKNSEPAKPSLKKDKNLQIFDMR